MIVVTGSLAFDYIFNFPGKFAEHIMPDKIHNINLSFIVDKFVKRFGGTAGNISYNLSLLGIKSILLGTVGNDFGAYKKWLKNHGVIVDYLKTTDNEGSSLGFSVNDKANNQIWGYCYGALRHTKVASLQAIKSNIEMMVISPTYLKVFINFTKEAIKRKIPYLYDFGMILTTINKTDLIAGILNSHTIIGNDYEMALMFKKTGLSKKQILNKVNIIITTLGEKGSIIETKRKKITIASAKPTKVLDPTGAGDAYRAGFLAGYLQNKDLEICGKMASVSSVYAVEKYGTQEHHYTKKEFYDRYKENYKEALKLT